MQIKIDKIKQDCITESQLKEFHDSFKNKFTLKSAKVKTWAQAELQSVYSDLVKLVNYLGEDQARPVAKTWFREMQHDPNWMYDKLPFVSVIWFQILEIHALHATNVSRSTVETLLIKINFISNGLKILQMEKFVGFSRYQKAQKLLTKDFI